VNTFIITWFLGGHSEYYFVIETNDDKISGGIFFSSCIRVTEFYMVIRSLNA